MDTCYNRKDDKIEKNQVEKMEIVQANKVEVEQSRGKKLNHSFTAKPILTPMHLNQIGPLTARQRDKEALNIRQNAALFQKKLPLSGHPSNGDEDLYVNKIGNYTKVFLHNQLGEVNINAYNAWIRALTTGNPNYFESLPLGGSVKLVNPQAAYAYNLAGPDSHHLSMIVPPTFNSAQLASEMAEEYWSALTRDVPFIEYNTNALTIEAASDLSKFTDFRGPKIEGAVTTQTLFRENIPGDLIGPYISQFFYKDIPFGAVTITQKYNTTVADDDYMTTYDEWLNIQNGALPESTNTYDTTLRYIRSGRDMGEWVHKDFSYQGIISACLILLSYGEEAFALENPYIYSNTQVGYITFGSAHVLDFTARAARLALETAMFQKCLVHRRLRPEEFGGFVHNNLTGASSYPINSEFLNSAAVSKTFKKYGTYLLPMAFSEGCPAHPSYPSGHACIAGAGVTMLKAFFNEAFIIPDPVTASSDGLSLLPYTDSHLLIGNELNKLAANIAIGRNIAGVHWRSDAIEGLKLGEAAAIGILQDYRETYNEDFSGFTFTKFDGNVVTI